MFSLNSYISRIKIRFRHNAEEIATELTSLNPEEIREYPITDLSDKDMTLVFKFLAPEDLAKVLLNIHQEDLVEVQDRLTPTDFGESK
jgi:Mg/Co/Ni transporter MgtE